MNLHFPFTFQHHPVKVFDIFWQMRARGQGKHFSGKVPAHSVTFPHSPICTLNLRLDVFYFYFLLTVYYEHMQTVLV